MRQLTKAVKNPYTLLVVIEGRMLVKNLAGDELDITECWPSEVLTDRGMQDVPVPEEGRYRLHCTWSLQSVISAKAYHGKDLLPQFTKGIAMLVARKYHESSRDARNSGMPGPSG